jgi:subtilase family serine protease
VKAWTLARYFVFASLPFFTTFGQAQQSLQVLHHHVRRAVSSGQAALAGSLPLTQRLNLAIVLPLRNQSELTSLLSRLYDPSCPDYRHFLSVDQFTQQFSPAAEDYQAVVDFARANGFTVTGTPANRMIVPISGSVAQVEKAFNVRMNNYQHPTEKRTFYSPDREPSLNVSVPVAHIAGLNNFSIPHPMVTKASANQVTVSPAVLGSGPYGSYLASDMRAAYYTSTLPTGSTALTGNGQTVGLLEFGGYNISDVTASFDGTATATGSENSYVVAYKPTADGTTYTIPVNNVLLDGANGEPSGGDTEEVLDIVQAIGMAPGLSQVRVYIGSSDASMLNSMATENIAKQLSISWGWDPDDPSTDDSFFQEFAAQGQSVFAASGDYGAFDAVISPYFYPAEDDYLTAVGGTDLITSSAGGVWSSEVAWDRSGGGISPDNISIPSWQTGVANSANGGSTTLRNEPDVAAEANTDNYNCNMGSCQGSWGGTSFAAPRWAGFTALVNQQAVSTGNPTVGFINPAIYAIGESSNYGSDLHDITSGNNDDASQPVWFSAVTGYDLVTGWGSPTGQNLINALAGPPTPGFWIVASSSALSINQGSYGTSIITVNHIGGFTGSVDLAVTSGLPSGVTASWSANPATGSSVLTLTASNTATPGTAPLIITATSGTLIATTTVALTVHSPTFALSALPSGLPIIQGASGKSTVSVTPEYGFSGSVNLSASGLPKGVTASWGTNPTTGTSVLTLTASSTASLGTVAATIIGTSSALTITTALDVTINAVPAATTTTLTVTANGAVVTSVAAGTVVTLTAAVSAGSATVTTGQVKFCDATAAHCEDIHILGTAQLTSAGTAVLKFIPGIGSHSYKAVFVGTIGKGASSSSPSALTVTAAYASTATIAQSGVPGNYTLSTTVTGQGAVSPTGTVSFLDTSNVNAVLGTAALGEGQTTLSWLNSQSPATGDLPYSVAVGDFNGDGMPDLAVANNWSDTVTILLGNGDGTFTAQSVSPATGSGPIAVVVGDFNGDGKADLAVANAASDTVTILLGNGDGTFTAQTVSPPTGSEPYSVAVGDFNGDGIPDLAVANNSGKTVTILLGNGDGTFNLAPSLSTAGYAEFVAVGDFNGDGIPDLAVTTATTTVANGFVSIFLGNGDGTFAPASSPATGFFPLGIAVGDFNGDGKADLAVANYANSTFTILLGNGDGTFTPAPSPAVGYVPWSVAVGDFNGDGKADLAVTNSSLSSLSVSILLGNGDGTFTTAPSPSTGSGPVSVAVGDFNKNGIADLVVANANNDTLTVLTTQLTQKVTAMATGISPVGTGTHQADASYPGDSGYSASTSSTTGLTAELPVPTFTVTGTSVTVEPGATTGITSTITATPSGGFTGNVSLTAAITSSPTGAQYLPTLSFGSTSPVSITGATAGTATLTISTTAATSASLAKPVHCGFPWYTEGGAALACILLIGIPAQRRRWWTMLGMLALLVTLTGGVLACGGGGGGGIGTGGNSNPGTTAGAYTITVTGTSGTTTANGTVTLTVQ